MILNVKIGNFKVTNRVLSDQYYNPSEHAVKGMPSLTITGQISEL